MMGGCANGHMGCCTGEQAVVLSQKARGAILKLGLGLAGEQATTNLFWAKAQRGETKTMTQARRKITAGLEENLLDGT